MSFVPSWISSRRPLPSAFATAMSVSFVVVNASSVPSGDHDAAASGEASGEIVEEPLPSTLRTTTEKPPSASPETNAIRVPSGDHESGWGLRLAPI